MSKIKSRLTRRRTANTDEPGRSRNEEQLFGQENRSQIVEQLRARMEKITSRGHRTPPPDETVPDAPVQLDPLPGEEVETDLGAILVRRVEYRPEHCHGTEPVAGFLTTGPGLGVLARDEALTGLDPTTALFLDTETTGLSGGTGTLPFLIGVGIARTDGSFLVEQFFCREPSEERAQLHLLARRLEEASYLVTFNGRAFDMPLVNTRFVMNRMKNPGHSIPHLDLLHVARRIFKRRLDDRSLTSLERSILGFERVDDIPGAAIPAAYSDYLRRGSTGPMISVLEHNAMDLIALAALGGVLERMYTAPAEVEHAADALGLARAAIDAGQKEAADRHLETATLSRSSDHRREGLYMAARHAARHKDFDRARDLWHQALNNDAQDGWAHLALAKHYEHREKLYANALEHARQSGSAEGDEASAYRVARIERKISRLKEKK